MSLISVVLQLLILSHYQQHYIIVLSINIHQNSNTDSQLHQIHVYMPKVQPLEDDQYLCTAAQLNATDAMYIREIQFHFSPGRTHHYLLYGCYKISEDLLENGYWPCNRRGKGSNCSQRKQIPIGFRDNATPHANKTVFKYPYGVGYPIGSKYKINHIVLEIHYLKALPKGITDSSGVTILASQNMPNFLCGSLVFARVGFQIPPQREKFSLDMSCWISTSEPIYPYASWVHTHDLGSVVSAYVIHSNSSSKSRINELIRWTHHWPQPVPLNSKKSVINPGDIVAAKCTYNSTEKTQPVNWGTKRSDEMCNLFLSFYTSNKSPIEDLSISCVNELSREITHRLPKNADTLPSQSLNKILSKNEDDIVCRMYKKFNIPC